MERKYFGKLPHIMHIAKEWMLIQCSCTDCDCIHREDISRLILAPSASFFLGTAQTYHGRTHSAMERHTFIITLNFIFRWA